MKIKYKTIKEIKEITLNYIISLKSKNSHGYDEIPMKILQVITPCVISPLTYICNQSLS